MQSALVLLVFLVAAAYLLRGLFRSLSGNCGGCGGTKKSAVGLISVSDLTARVRDRRG